MRASNSISGSSLQAVSFVRQGRSSVKVNRLSQRRARCVATFASQTVDAAEHFTPVSSSEKTVLKNLTLPQLEQWCRSIGEKDGRAMQIWRWMYYKKLMLREWGDTIGQQNGFSQAFLEKADACATLQTGLHLESCTTASDGTKKLLFSLDPGSTFRVETVLIPIFRKGHKQRVTVCVSSQVGCAMNCQFCYTGRMGLLQNLTTAQIVEQLVVARRILAEDAQLPPATNIVFMGMGEPLNNLDAVLAAIEIATHPLGLQFSKHKVTVSTVGLVPEIRKFCAQSEAQLAVSLHAPTDEIRDWIAPINRRYPLAELKACLEELFPKDRDGGFNKRHVLFEYVMLDGVNDHPDLAHKVLELVQNIECKFNLIVFNPHEGTTFRASAPAAVDEFRSILIQGGLVCTVRDSRGQDEMAACGQLGNPGVARKPVPTLSGSPIQTN